MTINNSRSHRIYTKSMNIGNHLFAFLFAKQISKSLAGSETRIFFDGIPELGISAHRGRGKGTNQLIFNSKSGSTFHYRIRNHTPCIDEIISLSELSDIALHVNWPVCNINYILPLQEAQEIVPGIPGSIDKARLIAGSLADTHLMVHVRAGDILQKVHKNYVLTPFSYIRKAQNLSSLPLAFFGQTEDSWYMNDLRKEFPHAVIVPTQEASIDFEIARQARFLMISTSTFSWLAGWLSKYQHAMYVPVLGFLDQKNRPDINLTISGKNIFYLEDDVSEQGL